MSAQVLVSTDGLSRDEWLEWRRRGIGSSDAPAVAGLDPYQTPMGVWLDKTSQIPDRDETEPMRWGLVLEDAIAGEWAKRHEVQVESPRAILQHPDVPWALANLDRRLVDRDELLEVKNVGDRAAQNWEDFDTPPEKFVVQVQHQLYVTGWERGHLAVLVGGKQLLSFEIERDDELIGHLVDIEASFWDLVERRQPPAVDGSEATKRALESMFPQGVTERVVLGDDARQAIVAYQSASARLKAAKEAKDLAGNQLRALMGDAIEGWLEGEKVVSWTEIPAAPVSYVRDASRRLWVTKKEIV